MNERFSVLHDGKLEAVARGNALRSSDSRVELGQHHGPRLRYVSQFTWRDEKPSSSSEEANSGQLGRPEEGPTNPAIERPAIFRKVS